MFASIFKLLVLILVVIKFVTVLIPLTFMPVFKSLVHFLHIVYALQKLDLNVCQQM